MLRARVGQWGLFSGKKRKALVLLTLHFHDNTPSFHGSSMTQENYSATWLAVTGFMVLGLVSGLLVVNHSDSSSLLVT